MSDETQDQAPAPAPKKALKRATITVTMDQEVNQNDFKNWLKSCPVSFEGGQTITWENLPSDEPAAEEAA